MDLLSKHRTARSSSSIQTVFSLIMKEAPSSAVCGERTYIQKVDFKSKDILSEWLAYRKAVEQIAEQRRIPFVSLPASEQLPDSFCPYDVCLRFRSRSGERIAIGARMGPESRRPEVEAFRRAFEKEPLWDQWIELGQGRLEFGDVILVPGEALCLVGKRINDEGRTVRSDDQGRQALREILADFGIKTREVPFEGGDEHGALHLTSKMSYAGRSSGRPVLLIDPLTIRSADVLRDWGFLVRGVSPAEGWGANVAAIDDAVIVQRGFPERDALLAQLGIQPTFSVALDTIELTETSLTCMFSAEINPFLLP